MGQSRVSRTIQLPISCRGTWIGRVWFCSRLLLATRHSSSSCLKNTVTLSKSESAALVSSSMVCSSFWWKNPQKGFEWTARACGGHHKVWTRVDTGLKSKRRPSQRDSHQMRRQRRLEMHQHANDRYLLQPLATGLRAVFLVLAGVVEPWPQRCQELLGESAEGTCRRLAEDHIPSELQRSIWWFKESR